MTSVAHVDLGAISHNVSLLVERVHGADVCAVVKADGYGHGAVPVAGAALAAGATSLAVANVGEAATLRASGIEAPILVLSEPDTDDGVVDRALALGCQLVVHRRRFLEVLAARADALDAAPVDVHLKVDTGMRRVGCEPVDALDLARFVADHPRLHLAGTMTHLATADEPANPTTDAQLDRFDAVLAGLVADGIDPGVVHAANSAGAMVHPRARHSMVRVGIALYGIAPSHALEGELALRPALTWTSRVSLVKQVPAGEAVSYGHRHRFEHDTWVATVPVGYADGLRRRLGLAGGQVLVGGRRRPMRGVVTMDQVVVELGRFEHRPDVAEGDEVVLVGVQGDDAITANEMGAWLDTIGYEVTCAISPRVERRHR